MFEHGKMGCSDQIPGALVLNISSFKLSSRHKNALLLKRKKINLAFNSVNIEHPVHAEY